MSKHFLGTKVFIFLLPAVLISQVAQSQYYLSNIVNHGSSFVNNRYAEVVNAAGNGIGYRASAGGIFYHSGPPSATITVNGGSNVYDAYTSDPANPGRDYFMGYDNAGSNVEIAGNSAPVFGALYLANGTGNAVTVSNSKGIAIGSQLVLSSGIVNTARASGYTSAVHFGPAATYSSTALGDGQYINGYVSKAGTSAFTFPVGDQSGSDLRTLSISSLPAIADTLAVAYWRGDPGTALDPTGGPHSRASISTTGIAGVSMISSVSPIGFWDWIPVSGNGPVTVSVSIPDFSGAGGYSNASAMRLVGWNTSTAQWENLGGTAGASSTTEGAVLSGTLSDMSTYSALAIGNVNAAPLPVKLESFSASIDQSCKARLHWKVPLERNIKSYSPEYSPDGISFASIGDLEATNDNDYSHSWGGQKAGTGYYRLKVIMSDGSNFYSQVIRLYSDCNGSTIRLSPNPAKDRVTISGLTGDNDIQLLNSEGKVIQNVKSITDNQQLSLQGLPAGIYFIQLAKTDDKRSVSTFKIVKE